MSHYFAIQLAATCQCRSIIMEPDNYNDIKQILNQWTMLTQFIAFNDNIKGNKGSTNSSNSIALTKNELQAKRLKVLYFTSFAVSYVDNSIGSLSELQILGIRSSILTQLPWNSLSKLTKLTFVDISYNPRIDDITDGVCNWKNIRFVSFAGTDIPYIPDCVSNNWLHLQTLFISTSGIASIPKGVFQLPRIKFVSSFFSQITNITFNNQDKWSNSLQTVYLQHDEICDNIDKLSQKTQEFIDYFDACDEPCTGTGCLAVDWGTGICNAECDNSECFWDNGDCNQLCLCNSTLWANGICDAECNNTDCNYDFGDCSVFNNTQYCFESFDSDCYNYSINNNYNYNYNYNDMDTIVIESNNVTLLFECNYLCPDSWLNDGWCDMYCQKNKYHNSNCVEEENDCTECSDRCLQLWVIFYDNILEQKSDHMTLQDCYNTWNVVANMFSSVVNVSNCTQAWKIADLNQDDMVSFYELMHTAAVSYFLLSQEKSMQINCSNCMFDESRYY